MQGLVMFLALVNGVFADVTQVKYIKLPAVQTAFAFPPATWEKHALGSLFLSKMRDM